MTAPTIDPALLLNAIDERRRQLGELRARGGAEATPLTYVEVAAQVGTHSATFSRLRKDDPQMPGAETMQRLLGWLNIDAEELTTCTDCPPDAETGCTDCGDHAIPEEAVSAEDATASPDHAEEELVAGDDAPTDRVAAIVGTGRLSESEDTDTQAAVTRVRELLTEGAVGVSIRTDLNPDDMPDQETIDQLIADEKWEELDELFASIQARPRHVAIVDTAAFSDARLTLGEDGMSVSGPVTFEGVWTGDVRTLPYGGLVWDEDLLPISLIWDREDGDHTGTVVGVIDTLERVDGVTASARGPEIVEAQVQAVAAAAGPSADTALPARLFSKFNATKPQALHIDAPDSKGLRRIYGHAAPRGVCHRSDMGACFQYPGDVDKSLAHFHTGAAVELDSGETIRVGALTSGGMHLDTGLARQGVSTREANRHREDANQVLAMVRAWEDSHGLAISGVVLPGVTEGQLMAAMASAPSVELWPEGRGRTLVGIHLVPTPAWPVTASAGGDAVTMTAPQGITVELETQEAAGDLDHVLTSLARIEKALGALAADALTDVPIPEDTE